MEPIRIVVLVSGRGTNLQALLDACMQSHIPALAVAVISNVPGVEAIKRANRAGVPTVVLDHKTYGSREEFDEALQKHIDSRKPDLVVLAGFMRRLGEKFVNHYRDRIINIHPSLLPAFPGMHVHERVIQSGARFSGCTVHFVRPELDSGPIILQVAVPVHPSDTPQTLARRVLEVEQGSLVQVVTWFAESRLEIIDEKVLVHDASPPNAIMVNPNPRINKSEDSA